MPTDATVSCRKGQSRKEIITASGSEILLLICLQESSAGTVPESVCRISRFNFS
jgi:hypothetical protein